MIHKYTTLVECQGPHWLDVSFGLTNVYTSKFQVVTGKKRFSEYLQDAERLFLEIHSNDDEADMKVVGYSIIERLNRLIKSNSISEDTVRIVIFWLPGIRFLGTVQITGT